MANSELQTLLEIFNHRIFRVPDYQRGYAWGETQLEDFWEDLQNLKDGKHHYTGLLTVEDVKKEEVEKWEKWQDDLWMFAKGFNAFHIIDGQQRLTTTIILLKVIFDRFGDDESINYEEKNDLIKKFLYQQAGDFKSYIFGYEKDNPSDEYFKTKILNQPSLAAGIPERTLYTANLESAKKFFEGKTEKFSKPELEALYKKVVTGLKFNFYEIDNDLDVFVAFEVMNNRGKPLSTLELLKNRVIYLSTLLENDEDDKAKLRKNINEAWKTVYEYLGKNKDNPLDDDEFLRNHWIMYFGYERGEAGAFTNFLLKELFVTKNILDKNAKTPVNLTLIKNYVDSLSESVKVWFYIFNPNYSTFSNETKEWLGKLNRVGFGAFAPLVMAAMLKKVNEGQLIKLLKLCERFVFLVFRISRRQANTQNNNFYRLAKSFYYSQTSIADVLGNVNELTDGNYGWYDLTKFIDYMEDQFNREQGFYSWNGLRYFLYEYELHLQSKAGGVAKTSWEIATKTNSIEHIYPQDTKDKCWTDKFPKGKQAYIALHSLGNLLLLSQTKNSELQNKCFDFKKKHDKKGNDTGYFNGSYSEIEVSQFRDWTADAVLQRGIKMLEFMEQRWNIQITNKKKVLCWKG